MRSKIVLILINIFIGTALSWAAPRKFTLVIDAGHGGNDAGAVGAISKEKDINLRTALAFGGYVERNCPDVNVIYTRKKDVFVTLYDRANIANKAKADLFISIHTNALPKGKVARGFETYTLGMHRASDNLDVAKRENSVILVEKDYQQHYEGFDPNSAESYIMFEFLQDHFMAKSVELAKLVQSNVCSLANRPNKGVKQAGFLVLRETSMPSCLIELGFISTRDEEQYLNNSTNIDNMARGIYNAFIAYKQKNSDTEVSVSYPTEERNDVVMQPTPAGNQVEAKAEVKPITEVKASDKVVTPAAPVTQPAPTAPAAADVPVFKIQILTSDKVLKTTDPRFKGEKTEHFKEGNMVKYTVGSTTDYNEILRLRKTISEKFPGSFVIAFKGGEKIPTADAIREFKKRK